MKRNRCPWISICRLTDTPYKRLLVQNKTKSSLKGKSPESFLNTKPKNVRIVASLTSNVFNIFHLPLSKKRPLE